MIRKHWWSLRVLLGSWVLRILLGAVVLGQGAAVVMIAFKQEKDAAQVREIGLMVACGGLAVAAFALGWTQRVVLAADPGLLAPRLWRVCMAPLVLLPLAALAGTVLVGSGCTVVETLSLLVLVAGVGPTLGWMTIGPVTVLWVMTWCGFIMGFGCYAIIDLARPSDFNVILRLGTGATMLVVLLLAARWRSMGPIDEVARQELRGVVSLDSTVKWTWRWWLAPCVIAPVTATWTLARLWLRTLMPRYHYRGSFLVGVIVAFGVTALVGIDHARAPLIFPCYVQVTAMVLIVHLFGTSRSPSGHRQDLVAVLHLDAWRSGGRAEPGLALWLALSLWLAEFWFFCSLGVMAGVACFPALRPCLSALLGVNLFGLACIPLWAGILGLVLRLPGVARGPASLGAWALNFAVLFGGIMVGHGTHRILAVLAALVLVVASLCVWFLIRAWRPIIRSHCYH